MKLNTKHLRKERGMTQGQLADAIGKTEHYITKLENGHSRPSMIVLERVAKVFQVSLDELVLMDGVTDNT